MGRAATLNPRSRQGKREDPEADALAALRQHVEVMNRLDFERWLLSFPAAPGLTLEQTRLEIRRMLRPFCRFTIEARRARRLETEARQRLVRERALLVATEALKAAE